MIRLPTGKACGRESSCDLGCAGRGSGWEWDTACDGVVVSKISLASKSAWGQVLIIDAEGDAAEDVGGNLDVSLGGYGESSSLREASVEGLARGAAGAVTDVRPLPGENSRCLRCTGPGTSLGFDVRTALLIICKEESG